MGNTAPKKLAYFLSHPIQYFSPLLQELSQATGLEVYYFSEAGSAGKTDRGFGKNIQWDTPLLQGYDYKFLPNLSRSAHLDNHFLDAVNPGVIGALWKTRAPVVIVNGWTYSSTLMTIFFGRLFGKKIWLRAENPLNQELGKRPAVRLLKRLFLKHLLFRFFVSKCLYIGRESRAFFEYYGVKAHRLVYTPYAVENERFSARFAELRNDLPGVRARLGLPGDKKIILFCGKYIPKKRPMDLLKAYQRLEDQGYALVMVGEGECRQEMEKYIRDNQLVDVYLTGFVNQSNIPLYYAITDVFVMCSGEGETWGLSVNEAMNFEKPVIVSRICGCCEDLVKDGDNGFSFEMGDIPALAECLQKTLNNETFLRSAGRRSGEIIQNYSTGRIVSNMIAAL
jgi:glycosyltransferase involved in cell wall biosynthesis